MDEQKVKIIFDVDAEISKANNSISNLTKTFEGIGGSKGNQLRELLSNINTEYEKLADKSGKTMSKAGDFTKVENSAEKVELLLKKVNTELKNTGKLSNSELKRFFPSEVTERINKTNTAIKTYNTTIQNSNKKVGAIGKATEEYAKQEKVVERNVEALKKLQNIKQGNSSKQVVTSDTKAKKQYSLNSANAEVKQYVKEAEVAQEAMEEFKVRKADLFERKTQNRSSEFRQLRDDLDAANKNLEKATSKANGLKRELDNMVVGEDLDNEIKETEQALKNAQEAATRFKANLEGVTAEEVSKALDEAKKKLEGLSGVDLSKINNIEDLKNLLERFTDDGVEGFVNALRVAEVEVNNLGEVNAQVGGKIREGTASLEDQNRVLSDVNGLRSRIEYFFSLSNTVMLFRRGLQQAFETIKELDAAMTETAVVTDFSVGDMWDQLPRYTQAANELGTTTLGAYETMTLFYQQGLDTNEVFEIGTETMKMARIAGLEYADATDLMTAALRGFNMELNESSATRINDVYSELAAVTAADTEEIATAMTKTASIASNANMEFETTAALLSQIIETTREPAETAGTAMKTIIARFTEMKKASSDIIDVEGEQISVNKVDAALQSAGVALRDVNGEFRDLDDVFLELSSKWSSLDKMTQRYIATMAAGSRQQSRFIAMMQDYDRTMELVNAAYGSSGASQKQFEKTQESLASKLNKLKNAWNEFLMGISNSKLLKIGVDALTRLLNIVNKLTGNSGLLKLGVAIGALRGGNKIFTGLLKSFVPLKKKMENTGADAGVSLLKGLTKKIRNFKTGELGLDFSLDTQKFKDKIDVIKTDWNDLTNTIKKPVHSSFDENFQVFDDKIAATLNLPNDTTRTLEEGLSDVSIEAIRNSKSFSNGKISRKDLKEILDSERTDINELIKLSEKNKDNPFFEHKGVTHINNREYRENLKKTKANLEADSEKVKELLEKTGKTEGVGTWATGLKSIASSLAPILKILLPIVAVLGTIAAIAAIIYNTSPLKHAKNEVEETKQVVEDYNRALEQTKEKSEALNNIIDEISSRNTVFDGLVAGSAEFYQAVAESNEKLLEQIELLKSLGYDIKFNYDENGLIQVENIAELRQAQKEANERQIELQKRKASASRYSKIAEKKEEFVSENFTDTSKKAVTLGGSETDQQPYVVGGQSDSQLLLEEVFSALWGSTDFTDTQEEELNNLTKEAIAADWEASEAAKASETKKAGQAVITHLEDAYDKFGTPNQEGYKVDLDGNPELKKYGFGISKNDLEDVYEAYKYSNWDEVAAVLGVEYDGEHGADGLYTTDSSGKKVKLEISSHGQIDNSDDWAKWINDPNGKNIDAGYLAYKLALGATGKLATNALAWAVENEDVQKQILYGTNNWESSDSDSTEVSVEITDIADEQLRTAAENAAKKANKRKTDFYTALGEIGDASPKLNWADNDKKSLAERLQRLEVDADAVTAAAYQAFAIEKIVSDGKTVEGVWDEYKDLWDGLKLADRGQALTILNEKIEQGVEGAQELKDSLTAAGGSLGIDAQFSELLTSGTLDAISEQISELSDEAGNIDVTATRELVDSNVELKQIMDEFNVSGYAMGKILSDIQKGELTLTDINKGLVESYRKLYSAMGQAEDVLYDLRNADLGEDYTEIGRTYEERYNTIKDLYDRAAYGSENFAGNIKSLIGEDAWQEYLTNNANSIKAAWEEVSKDYFLNKNNGNLYGSFSSLISAHGGEGIFTKVGNSIQYDLSGVNTYDEVLDKMVEAFKISREYAKALLADMATYSDTLQNDLDALNAAAMANDTYNQMAHRKNGEDIEAYTNLTDTEIEKIFGKTEEWQEALKKAKELQKKVVDQFKEDQKIFNTWEENQIESVDSLGNIYYRENGKLEANVDQAVGTFNPTNSEIGVEIKKDSRWVQELLKDKTALQASMELDTEQFEAFLKGYTGEEDVIEIMAEVGVTQESFSGLAKLKSEVEGTILAIAQTLKDYTITIPISIPSNLVGMLFGQDASAKYKTFDIKIGGDSAGIEDSNTVQSGSDATSKIIENLSNFTAKTGGSGTGYPNGSDLTNGGNGSSSDSEKESDKLKSKIDELDSAIQQLADNDIVDMQLVNKLIQQKIALQKEYKKSLEKELEIISSSVDEAWEKVKKAGNDKYIRYNEETGHYAYTDSYYEDFFKDGIAIDSEQMQKVQQQADQLNQLNSDQLANQIAIKELVDNLVQNQAEDYNAERALTGRERRQTEADREEELIGALPEEIQPFFTTLNTIEDAYLELQEIQANRVLAENKKQELEASYAGVPDSIKEYLTFDEYAGYGFNFDKINQIEDQQAREDMMVAVKSNAEVLNTLYDDYYEIHEQLSGGKLQKAIISTGKALKDFAKEISDGEISSGLKNINTGFEALDNALNSLADNLEDNETIEKILSTKVLPSLHLNEEQTKKLASNKNMQKALENNAPLQRFVFEAMGAEGISVGGILGAISGSIGEALETIGSVMNFDMMQLLSGSGGMIEQGKQMAEQIVGYITQTSQILIDAWTNREDILYNFLQILEKYLHDYEKMQRYSTQLEKGRLATVKDIQKNWEEQWQSLQDQLEMQQERVETRQQQLDMSRWSPFQLISGWDPTSDALYENRSVKMIWDILIGAIGMLPLGLGAFGSQLSSLYEDYDKRVQEAYEDRLAAEQAILDIEDERLELVKIGAEEAIEFEQKVLDVLVQKEQEQIDELSRLNDAITDANSKLISTLQNNLEKLRQDRENEKKEEELSEKQRRLSYLRQDTSGANMLEIKKLEEQLEEEHEDYTDTLIDQKISELEEQNELAAEQRQQQIDLLQAQLDWNEKYGLYWDAIYGMLYVFDENGNAILNPENFDLDGNIRQNSELAKMLGTFSDVIGMSVWGQVMELDELKKLGRYAGAFVGKNGLEGQWADYWALLNPSANDPDYAAAAQEIPEGIWGILYRLETGIKEFFGSSNTGLWNMGERMLVGIKNTLGEVFNIEEWANATAQGFHREDVIGSTTLDIMNGWNKMAEEFLGITSQGARMARNLTAGTLSTGYQNGGETTNKIDIFIDTFIGEDSYAATLADKISRMFTTGIPGLSSGNY